MNDIISSSRNHLKSKGFHYPDEWLVDCLEWLFQEHKDSISEMTNRKWCELVEQQWLFTDLRDFNTPGLLVLTNSSYMFFDGICCFQIMSVINISKSFYRQIKELTGGVSRNQLLLADQNESRDIIKSTSSNRTLKMILTDGVTDITAMEYEPWSHIEIEKLVIGSKCRLTGRFMICEKLAFLKQDNITLIGGAVDELSETSPISIIENQLQSNLGKPIKKEKKVQHTKVDTKPIITKSEPIKTETLEPKSSNSFFVDKLPLSNLNDKTETIHPKTPDSFCDDDFDFMFTDDDFPQTESTINALEINSPPTEPVIKIIDLFHELSMYNASNIESKRFKICASIMKFNSKLGVVKVDESSVRWNLDVLLGDGTATVSCMMDDQWLADRISFQASQLDVMKRSNERDRCKEMIDRFLKWLAANSSAEFTLLLSDKFNKLSIINMVPQQRNLGTDGS